MGHDPMRTSPLVSSARRMDGPSMRQPVNPSPPKIREDDADEEEEEDESRKREEVDSRPMEFEFVEDEDESLVTALHCPSSLSWKRRSWKRRSTSCHRLSARSNPASVEKTTLPIVTASLNRPPRSAGRSSNFNRSPLPVT